MYDLVGYEGKYKINESGVIINKNGHPMRTAISNSGYLRTALEQKDGTERKNESIHRLVAKQFIPNPNNLPVVLHKDNDTLNNHVSNLKWGTQSENIQQAFEEGRKESPMIAKSRREKFVYQIYNEDESIVIDCIGRTKVAEEIGYKEISLKNMIGNGRKIALGPYKDYMIRRTERIIIRPFEFIGNTSND